MTPEEGMSFSCAVFGLPLLSIICRWLEMFCSSIIHHCWQYDPDQMRALVLPISQNPLLPGCHCHSIWFFLCLRCLPSYKRCNFDSAQNIKHWLFTFSLLLYFSHKDYVSSDKQAAVFHSTLWKWTTLTEPKGYQSHVR